MRILIVDDEEGIREIFKRKCAQKGWDADAACSGDEALAKISTNLYDAVLLDLLIPGKDGYSVLEEIKRNKKLKIIPVFALTNVSSESSVKRALALGAVKTFIKVRVSVDDILTEVAQTQQ